MSRGFAVVSAFQKHGIRLPKRATIHSAGYDLEAALDLLIPPKCQCLCPTGIKAYMEKDEVLNIYPRSSLFKKKSLILTNSVGIIDADYYDNHDNEGHILISLYNVGEESVSIQKGERIAQAIFGKYLLADEDDFISGSRLGGFGSTDLKE